MKYIDEVDLKNKKVILRCDFNVPIKNGKILDDTRIKKSLITINYLLEQNCAIIILSHLGRIKIREDKINNSLRLVVPRLSELLNKDVKFVDNPVGMDVLRTCKELKNGEVALLENTRYCDYPAPLESKNDINLSKYWSCLGDVFINDAFATLHRNHASVAGISQYKPTYFGFLVKEELEHLNTLVDKPSRPYSVLIGGAKVDDKLQYIKSILPKCDYLLIGGGIANSFLYACGYDVKDSLSTSDEITLAELRTLVKDNPDKIIMPIDFVIEDNQILDLGEKSIAKYVNYFNKSKTIFINGAVGKFEESRYARGTVSLFSSLKSVNAVKIAGGGDTLNAIESYDLDDSFTFLSSGGGASLEYISTGKLAALDYINNNNN